MQKILFDLTSTQPEAIGKFHGGSEYAKFIFFQALKTGISNIAVVYNRNIPIDKQVIAQCKQHALAIHEIENKSEISTIIKDHDYKRFYSAIPYTYGDHCLDGVEFIFTLHGLRSLEMPFDSHRYFYVARQPKWIGHLLIKIIFALYLTKNIKTRTQKLFEIPDSKVITDSEHSKYSILSFFPSLSDKRVRVFYAPMDLSDIALKDKKEDFFLLVSANRWIKNNYRAILALDNLFSKGLLPGKNVVVLGCDNAPKIKRVKNPERFHFLNYVDSEELDQYMKKAFCFIYPTLNEGFGYPPVHAMKYGTPVLASAISSVPEVCRDAASYLNPYSVAEIENRILQITLDKSLYRSLQSKGIENARRLKQIQDEHLPQLIDFIFN